MRVKTSDDKSERLAFLEALATRPNLDAKQRDRLRSEISALREGAAGEQEAAFYLDRTFGASRNVALIHDLRLVEDGQVAQIDHLLLTRSMDFYLLETKSFNGNLIIDEAGEFTVQYARGRRYGIPSPIEQSRRHEPILRKTMARLGIAGRNGGAPKLFHCVLLHPKATITRPSPTVLDTSNVMKADMFDSWFRRQSERDAGVLEGLGVLLNARAADTVHEFANRLIGAHVPPDPRSLPPSFENVEATFGGGTGARRLVCSNCQAKITLAEGKYCWNRSERFGGEQYCRTHQADFPARGPAKGRRSAVPAA